MAERLIEIEAAKTNLLDCAAYLAENIKNTEEHTAALKEIVPRYLNRGAVDRAAELANSADDSFTRDRLLRRVAEKCGAIGDDEYAFQLIEAIEDFTAQEEARGLIAVRKAENGNYAKAFEIAETLTDGDYAYSEIAVWQAESNGGDPLPTLEKIEFPPAKITALQNVAQIKSEKNESVKAVELLDRATALAAELEFAEEKISTLLNIGYNFIEAGQNGKAIEVFDRAKASAETLDTIQKDSFLSSIALGFLSAGSLELADRTLDLVGDNVQISSTLVGFAREFWDRDEKSEALETIEEGYSILRSQRDHEVRDRRARFDLWAVIAVQYAVFEKPERAVEIAQEIFDGNAQTSALSQIAQICAASNNDDFARQAVNTIGDDSLKMYALLGISDVKNEAENTEAAVKFLTEAETYAESVEQLSSRSAAYSELARRFYAFGNAEKAHELGIKNLDTIFNIRDESTRAVALAQMSDFYQAGDLELTAPEREMILRIIGKSNG